MKKIQLSIAYTESCTSLELFLKIGILCILKEDVENEQVPMSFEL